MSHQKTESGYAVEVSTTANVSSWAVIKAESEEEAEVKALEMAKEGKLIWKYMGLPEQPEFEANIISKGNYTTNE